VSPKTIVSKKIVKKTTVEDSSEIKSNHNESETKTDFDDFANQLS